MGALGSNVSVECCAWGCVRGVRNPRSDVSIRTLATNNSRPGLAPKINAG